MKKSLIVTIAVCLLLPVVAAAAASMMEIDATNLNTLSQMATSQWGDSLPGYFSVLLMVIALIGLQAVKRK